jgi:hypothetical protein
MRHLESEAHEKHQHREDEDDGCQQDDSDDRR